MNIKVPIFWKTLVSIPLLAGLISKLLLAAIVYRLIVARDDDPRIARGANRIADRDRLPAANRLPRRARSLEFRIARYAADGPCRRIRGVCEIYHPERAKKREKK
ncbi:MAG: hypothetical protein GEU87_10460 [Alphaproteobacteria bacterium]|nr:hypothetical protein [Alphaproteobacteria bacterium]